MIKISLVPNKLVLFIVKGLNTSFFYLYYEIRIHFIDVNNAGFIVKKFFKNERSNRY